MKASELKYVAIATAFADHFFHGAYQSICLNCAGTAKKSSTDKLGFSTSIALIPDKLPDYSDSVKQDGKPSNILDCQDAADYMKKFLEARHGCSIGYLNFDWSCNFSESGEVTLISVHVNYKLA